jgi:hypothetical protein
MEGSGVFVVVGVEVTVGVFVAVAVKVAVAVMVGVGVSVGPNGRIDPPGLSRKKMMKAAPTINSSAATIRMMVGILLDICWRLR